MTKCSMPGPVMSLSLVRYSVTWPFSPVVMCWGTIVIKNSPNLHKTDTCWAFKASKRLLTPQQPGSESDIVHLEGFFSCCQVPRKSREVINTVICSSYLALEPKLNGVGVLPQVLWQLPRSLAVHRLNLHQPCLTSQIVTNGIFATICDLTRTLPD